MRFIFQPKITKAIQFQMGCMKTWGTPHGVPHGVGYGVPMLIQRPEIIFDKIINIFNNSRI